MSKTLIDFVGRTAVAAGVALIVCIGSPAGAQTPSTVTLDARGAAQQRASFRTGATVVVRVANKNPYLYRYRTTIDEVTVQETAPLAFVAQLGPLLAGVVPAPGGPGPSSAAPVLTRAIARPRLKVGVGCAAGDEAKATAALAWLDDERDALVASESESETAIRGLGLNYSTAKTQIDTRRLALRAKHATSAELDGAASGLKLAAELYPKPTDVDGADVRLRSTEAFGKAFLQALEEYRTTFPACQPTPSGGNPLIVDRVYVEGVLGWWMDGRRAVVTTVRSGRQAVTALTDAIDRIRAEGSLEELHPLGNYASPTDVTITVRRWPVDDADEKNIEVVTIAKLDFGGGARFLLSGGLGYVTGIVSRDFQQVRGYARTPEGEAVDKELVPVVGLKRSETRTAAPGLLLNTRLWRFSESSPVQSAFVTVGVTAKADNGADVDYILGLSAGLLGDRVIITGSLYFNRRQDLAGDLYLGAKVPDDFTTIPVTKSYERGFGLFVTYKIR